MKSVNLKTIFFISLLLLVFTIIIDVTTSISFSSEFNKTSEELMAAKSKQLALQVNQILQSVENEVEILADNALDNLKSPSVLSNPAERKQYEAKMEGFLKNALKNSIHGRTIYLRFNPEISTPTAGWFIQKQGQIIQDLPITDLSAYDSTDIEHVGWYYIPIGHRSGIWIEPYQNENIDVYMISYVIPLYKDGVTIGVIGMDIDFEDITGMLSGLKYLKTGYAYMRGKTGKVSFHPFVEYGGNYFTEKGYVESSQRLINDMTFILTAKKSELHAKCHQSIFASTIASLIVLIFAIGIFIFVQYNIKFKEIIRSGTKDNVSKNRISISIILIIFIFAILIFQIGFISVDMIMEYKGKSASIKANNTYENTITVVADKDFAPYSFENGNNACGYDVELINELGNRTKNNVKIELCDWNTCLEKVKTGNADVILSIESVSSIDDIELNKTIPVSNDMFYIYGKNPIQSISQIYGKSVGKQLGSSEVDIYGLSKNAIFYKSSEEVLASLENDRIDYAICRKAVAEEIIKQKSYKDIMPIFEIMRSNLCFGTSKANKELASEFNFAIKMMERDGTLSSLERKWLKTNDAMTSVYERLQKHSMFLTITGIFMICCILAFIFFNLRSYYEYKNEQKMLTLLKISETDQLTNILNRGAGEDKIRKLMDIKKAGMFCVLDADKFKSINDTYGHSVGDKVLIKVAECLTTSFRDRDIVMRLGGDEFAVYAIGVTTEELANVVSSRFFGYLDKISIPELGDKKISVSMGAAFYNGEGDLTTFEELYKKADNKAYESKKIEGNALSI